MQPILSVEEGIALFRHTGLKPVRGAVYLSSPSGEASRACLIGAWAVYLGYARPERLTTNMAIARIRSATTLSTAALTAAIRGSDLCADDRDFSVRAEDEPMYLWGRAVGRAVFGLKLEEASQ